MFLPLYLHDNTTLLKVIPQKTKFNTEYLNCTALYLLLFYTFSHFKIKCLLLLLCVTLNNRNQTQ